jgi:hypothetical protein
VILLDHGKIAADGTPRATCDLFYERSDEKIKSLAAQSPATYGNAKSTGEVELLDLGILDEQGCPTERVRYGGDVTFSVRIRLLKELDKVSFGVGVHTTDFIYLTTHTSERQIATGVMSPGEYEVACRVKQFPLLPGVYSLRLGIAAGVAGRTVFYAENLYNFQVVRIDGGPHPLVIREGFLAMDATWGAPRPADPAQSPVASVDTQ